MVGGPHTLISFLLASFLPTIVVLSTTITLAQDNSSCSVKIEGGSDNMYPGQWVNLIAQVNGSVPQSYLWTVQGDIIKDYDDNVLGGIHGTIVNPPIPMSMEDFLKPSISFYWKPTENKSRTVSLSVETINGVCSAERIINVVQGTDIDTQPEDFYVAQNHPFPTSTHVLAQHLLWHFLYPFNTDSYNGNGDLFFDFHRIYLNHFDAWRQEFGYPNITAWDPGTSLPNTTDVTHDSRSPSYVSQPMPTYFQVQPSGDGPVDRIANGNPCEDSDKPVQHWPSTQDALNDFDPNLELLGCALTDPYHNSIHMEVGGEGDMSSPDTAPLDPIFWRWHKFVDNIAVARGSLPPAGDIEESIMEAGANDTASPRIYYQNPFRLYPFITPETLGLEIPKMSIEFTEPVSGVSASDFIVNNNSATNFTGSGAGPYVFTGFQMPNIGPVNVTVLGNDLGNIVDSNGNRFSGESWEYEMIDSRSDTDRDGLINEEEIMLLIDPTTPDTDGDAIGDKIETSYVCLNPLSDDSKMMNMGGDVINSTGVDSDNDGQTNVKEIGQQSNPCT